MKVKVNEIFVSLSGEPDGFITQGGLATFVRLQGCNLNCVWCDTKYARVFDNWKEMSVEEVSTQCKTEHVVITGGEPLLQAEEVEQLVNLLSRRNQKTTIETNGSIPITIDPARSKYEFLRFVVDYKLNSSGMYRAMRPEVFDELYSLDVIKFVIADTDDYRQAKELVLKNQHWRAQKVFSPIIRSEWPSLLAKEITNDRLEGVTLALQWHKILKIR